MKMYFKNLIFALAGALAMTACSNEMEQQLAEGSGNSGQEVKFTVGIENLSRTAIAEGSLTTEFVKGDEIGIFAYDEKTAVASNVKYTYDGSAWTSDNAIAAKDGVQLSYYAYYPYKDGVTDPSQFDITVSADQTGGFSKDDVLTAQNTTAEADAPSVTLTFKHAFAMVQVGIKSGLTDDAEATVTLESIQPTALVNAKEATAVVSGDVTSIKMQKTSADKWEYRAIVPAQEIASGSKLLTIVAGGKTYAVTYSSAEGQPVSYVAGEVLQITVNSLVALPEGEEVTIGGSITDWDASTSDPGAGDVTEVPTESLDLSALPGLDFATIETKIGWKDDKVTGEVDKWYKRETTSGLVTYAKTESNEISMLLRQGDRRATWNSNSLGYHSGKMFDYTKKYTLTFNARCAGEESGNNLGVVILNTDDEAAFCKGDLSGTLYTAGINNTDKSYSVTFDFGQKSTSVATSGITPSPTSSDDTKGGINIVFFNNTNTENTKVTSTLYVKNIKLEVVKE